MAVNLSESQNMFQLDFQGTLTQACATWAVPKPSFNIAAYEHTGSTLASNQAKNFTNTCIIQ